MNEVYAFPFENMPDMIRWKWSNCGKFTTSSVYEQLTKNDSGNNFKHIWKSRIPHKIKIFLWLVEQNAILTKDNMIRRKWAGDPKCYFCLQNESVDHLFFQCPVAKVVWEIVGLSIGAYNTPSSIQKY